MCQVNRVTGRDSVSKKQAKPKASASAVHSLSRVIRDEETITHRHTDTEKPRSRGLGSGGGSHSTPEAWLFCCRQLNREAGYCLHMNEEAGLLHTTEQGDGVIRRQGYYTHMNKEARLLHTAERGGGSANFRRSGLQMVNMGVAEKVW